ncbi:HAMP domain-containing histidine kinase [Oxalobacteraceae bacterium]|nr:HAMP domain-containing histidine kinase [Oxalobacteraceae bacterium]
MLTLGLIAALTVFLLKQMRKLKKSGREILELNTSLELRVGQRTLDLELANAELGQTLRVLQATQDELLRTEKLAALGSLVAGVAHELNTPIGNGIMMASSLLANAQQSLDELRAGKPSRARLEHALEAGVSGSEILLRSLMRAGELVTSFKQVAVDQSSDQRCRFRLSRTLEQVVATLEPMYQKTGFAMTLQLDADVEMEGYPGALAQIISNLVSNALAHGFEGCTSGSMRIVTAASAAGRVALEFGDDGVGMGPEQIERVFEPFYTTKLGQGGSGLGMHIVYNLVTVLLGGSIAIVSAPGQGCRVQLLLPLVAPAMGRAKGQQAGQETRQQAGQEAGQQTGQQTAWEPAPAPVAAAA